MKNKKNGTRLGGRGIFFYSSKRKKEEKKKNRSDLAFFVDIKGKRLAFFQKEISTGSSSSALGRAFEITSSAWVPIRFGDCCPTSAERDGRDTPMSSQ